MRRLAETVGRRGRPVQTGRHEKMMPSVWQAKGQGRSPPGLTRRLAPLSPDHESEVIVTRARGPHPTWKWVGKTAQLNAAKPQPKRNQERRLPARYWLCRNRTGRR